jgi:uncharacterized protein
MGYCCAKCNHKSCETDEVSMTGGALSRMLDFSTNIFTAVSCERCGFTELYRANSTGIDNLLDGIGSL